jgi:DNA-3-methyladenine glycosylase I
MNTEKNIFRCFGNDKPFYAKYHDLEWGKPHHDDRMLFELLSLEGMQAGLSWEIVLKRRDDFRKLFHNFDPKTVANMKDDELIDLSQNPLIIRNKKKIFSIRDNAKVFLNIQKDFGSFDFYVWGFVNHKTITQRKNSFQEVPCSSKESIALSDDLKSKGMTFVGHKIMYSFMQAAGLVDDHIQNCHCSNSSTLI